MSDVQPTPFSERFERRGGGVGLLWLDRPARANALDEAHFHRLRADLSAVSFEEGLRVLVIAGRGRHFCGGIDLGPDNGALVRAFAATEDAELGRALIRELKACFSPLRGLPWPTIAAIEGACLGAGLELALHCDLRVAGRAARLSMPETRLGLVPDLGGSSLLRRLVGPGRAAMLCLSGREMDAAEGLSIGLLNEVVEDGGALAAALRLAEDVARGAPTATREVLRLLRHADAEPLADALALETEAGVAALLSAELVEAAVARLERRPPAWAGQGG